MIRGMIGLVVGVVGIQIGTSMAHGADGIEGDWVGGFQVGPRWVYVQAHFRRDGEKISGTADVPLEALFSKSSLGRRIDEIVVSDSRVRFKLAVKSGNYQVAGEFKENGRAIEGHVDDGKNRVPFRFDRTASVELKQYAGTYDFGRGRLVHLRPWVELGLERNALMFIDSGTGRAGVLFARSQKDFFAGPSVLVTYPEEIGVQFTLDDDGRATGLTWRQDKAAVAGRRVRFSEEEISFDNGGVRLAGTLISPVAKGKRPAIVIVPASTDRASREMGRHIAELFAFHGFAGLIYDKRGVGGSGGDWLKADFHMLADDTLAAVAALARRDDIDRRRIGLWGGSQGGWIVALAASKSREVALIVSQSGPAVTPKEQELYRCEHWLKSDGFGESEIAEALQLARRRYECAETDTGWEELRTAERAARKQSWYRYMGGHKGQRDPFWAHWRLIHNYDPAPVIAKVTCPTLVILGAKDTFLPAEKSAAIWRAQLGKAGNADFEVKVFENADHSLAETKTGGLNEVATSRRFVPGYFDLMRDWVLKRMRATKSE